MSLSIQTSYASLVTQNSLSSANDKLTTAMERLSTGYAVNSSADDAAGLSIATRMQSESDGMSVAQDNVEDASSMLSTADGALDEMTDIVGRMKDLATSAANGTYSDDDISAMNDEYSELAEELSSVMTNTSFGGTSLLDTTDGKLAQTGGVTFQVGASATETLNVDISTNLTTVSTGITTAQGITLDSTTASAQITAMEDLLSDVSDTRSSLGASMNRLDYASENLTNMQENTDTAIGNIMDADYAAETAEMSKQELLEQAGMSVLSSVSEMQGLITNLLG